MSMADIYVGPEGACTVMKYYFALRSDEPPAALRFVCMSAFILPWERSYLS